MFAGEGRDSMYTTNLHDSTGRPQASMGQPDDVHNVEAGSDQRWQKEFVHFLSHFVSEGVYIYHMALGDNLRAQQYFIEVDMGDITSFSEGLGQALRDKPAFVLWQCESGAISYAIEHRLFLESDLPSMERGASARLNIQVQLFWGVSPMLMCDLAHAHISSLVSVAGIVVKAGSSRPRCVEAVIQCSSCHHTTRLTSERAAAQQFPIECQENTGSGRSQKCRSNPYVLIPHESIFQDQQVIRLQELPEDVPTGELPRSTTVKLDRHLVETCAPGMRVQVVAIVSVQEQTAGARRGGRSTAGLRALYLKTCGLMFSSGRFGASMLTSIHQIGARTTAGVRPVKNLAWDAGVVEQFRAFARETDLLSTIARCIDPAVLGLEDQKRGIACLLFGGSRKELNGTTMRGDMNVLMIGDPSTAKSQLLKFTERLAPIAIYTSGKGSSAAGLTASVVGANGNFWLEAGAMVLADGGVACIDEFDKMREQDQVAIHEAMEQQTISIAKANLTTVLNSRTSVLAAANPLMGFYNPLQSNEDQLDFQGSLLTRFDLIFKVLDTRNAEMDEQIASHVFNLHQRSSAKRSRSGTAIRHQASGRRGTTASNTTIRNAPASYRTKDDFIRLDFLSQFIAYARTTVHPRIGEEAARVLEDFYVEARRRANDVAVRRKAEVRSYGVASYRGGRRGRDDGDGQSIHITPRQLESLIRITEAQARMRLDSLATAADAHEAIRLFTVGTLDAIASGDVSLGTGEIEGEELIRIEDLIRRRVGTGQRVAHATLVAELRRMDLDSRLVDKSLMLMMRRGELAWIQRRKFLIRNL